MLGDLWQDVRYGARTLRKQPGFTAVAIISIALGIGATAAMFTLVDHVLLRALPVHNPPELVQVTFTGLRYGNNWGDGTVSYPIVVGATLLLGSVVVLAALIPATRAARLDPTVALRQ